MSELEAAKILQECIDLKRLFSPATIYDAARVLKVDLSFRKNQVVHLHDVFANAPERSDTLRLMQKRLASEDCKALWREGNLIFEIINYANRQEGVLSWYGSGDFYRKHRDTRRDHAGFRLVTIVYYVNRVPERFKGGMLTFWKEQAFVELEPKHNRAIVFPSSTLHEVQSVQLDSNDWEDGRFSVNYWIGFK
jgi:predicted 2-oxoglutarate/Fe(II)-dependent dioxygenase YbiX